MFALAASLILTTWTSGPSADVWVYPHASDPGTAESMRIWGDGLAALDKAESSDGTFSYGFLSWDLKGIPKTPVKSAKLTLYAIGNEVLTAEIMEKAPIEVFALKGNVDEKTFKFGNTEVAPSTLPFGKSKVEKDGDGWKLTVDLLNEPKSEFAESFKVSREKGWFSIVLASSISAAESRGMMYKIHTKEGAKGKQPVLTIEFED